MNRYPISYIQYGNIPIRDSFPPTPTPPHAGAARRGAGGAWGGGWGGWGGIPYGYISILDIGYWISILSIYIYINKLIKYKEKTEMRETTGNPDLTGHLQ